MGNNASSTVMRMATCGKPDQGYCTWWPCEHNGHFVVVMGDFKDIACVRVYSRIMAAACSTAFGFLERK
uniref:Uncharacterized protein n=2 Tax=Oryza TaxID=4527 RepID=Q2QXJ9_ORYSJ|nr:hypothetical protein LOC_Os12g05790 [Oryza sativa Japonica Group]